MDLGGRFFINPSKKVFFTGIFLLSLYHNKQIKIMLVNLDKFNDDEYEGINLKIPYWFYNINRDKLEPILNLLKDSLENSLFF